MSCVTPSTLPLASSRKKWLAGISRTALILPLAFLAVPARADTPAPPAGFLSFLELYSATGQNATARTFSANTPATPGSAGGAIAISNNYTTSTAKGVAVQLGSMGGEGGKGASVPFAWEPGARGGEGGAITLVQGGALSGTGDQPTRAAEPLFELPRGSKWFSDFRSGAMNY